MTKLWLHFCMNSISLTLVLCTISCNIRQQPNIEQPRQIAYDDYNYLPRLFQIYQQQAQPVQPMPTYPTLLPDYQQFNFDYLNPRLNQQPAIFSNANTGYITKLGNNFALSDLIFPSQMPERIIPQQNPYAIVPKLNLDAYTGSPIFNLGNSYNKQPYYYQPSSQTSLDSGSADKSYFSSSQNSGTGIQKQRDHLPYPSLTGKNDYLSSLGSQNTQASSSLSNIDLPKGLFGDSLFLPSFQSLRRTNEDTIAPLSEVETSADHADIESASSNAEDTIKPADRILTVEPPKEQTSDSPSEVASDPKTPSRRSEQNVENVTSVTKPADEKTESK